MRLTAWHVALTLSATTHVAALGLVPAPPGAPPAGEPAARRIQLTVAAPTTVAHTIRVPRLLPERDPRPTPETPARALDAEPPMELPPITGRHEETAAVQPRTLAEIGVARELPRPQPSALAAVALARPIAGASGAPAPKPEPPMPAATPMLASQGAARDSGPAVPVAGANAPPAYPGVARRSGWAGKVLLDVRIDPAGKVTTLTVATSSGHRVLDDAAVAAVRGWRFTPARIGGVALGSRVRVPVEFRLEDARP